MFCHPLLILSLERSNTQRKAFFAKQNIAAVTGVYRDNRIILRKMTYVTFFLINITTCVQTTYPIIIGIPKMSKYLFAYTGHDCHIQHNVNRVCHFKSNLCIWRSNRTHGIRDYIHRFSFVAASCNIVKHFISFSRLFPVIGRSGILFFFRTDKCSCLYACNVIEGSTVQIATRQLFLIQFD